jgi:hypothetical protein
MQFKYNTFITEFIIIFILFLAKIKDYFFDIKNIKQFEIIKLKLI